jgi:hypothetical protein
MRDGWLMGGWRGLVMVMLAGLLLAWIASATPRTVPASGSPALFSSGRAFVDIRKMAERPHPVGSAQNARVRDQLMARLAGLGVSAQVQRQAGVVPWGGRSKRRYAVENVVARLPGRDRSAPALLVMSHYDSVPKSPGAADDMAGVASALELIRLLKQGPDPVRDVIFAFTDGEEAGLLGAQALFADPALLGPVGFVVNMEARGGGGRALMFQTSSASGGAERLFAATAAGAESNSLAAFIYGRMPNDTDFSVALAHGAPGLNYAFIGRPQLYHTPPATSDAVDPGAVQSLGAQAWAVVDALAHAPALPARGPDQTWFDVLGGPVVIYPSAWGWAPVGLTGLILVAAALMQRRGRGFKFGAAAMGLAQSLGATVLAAALLYLYGRVTVKEYYQALSHPWRSEGVIALAAFVASLIVLRLGGRPRHPLGRWWGGAFLAWLIAVGLQLAAPATAFLAAWPSLLAALALVVCCRSEGVGELQRGAAFVFCALALGAVLEVWHVLVLGVGLVMPVVGAGLLPLALAVLTPFLQGGEAFAGPDRRPARGDGPARVRFG